LEPYTLLRRFREFLADTAPEQHFGSRDKIAIKLHVGGPDSYTTVHPQFVRAITDRFRDHDNFLYVVDEHRAVRTAWQRGYTQETLGANATGFRHLGVGLDHPGAGLAWLLIVLVSVFDFHVRFPSGRGVHDWPGVPGSAPAPTAPGWPPST
jgi:hypothetical protein